MSKLYSLLIVLLAFATLLPAQDKHFTQFYSSPLNLNAALTGNYNGKYRASAIYRNQWNSVLESPFRTVSASFDARFNISRISKDAFAVGIMFYNDRAGATEFANSQLAISGAYHKALDANGKQVLSAGYQIGINQRALNFRKLSFNDQFNGVDGYTSATNEEFPSNNITYWDMNAGVFYLVKPKMKTNYYIGATVHHFSRPNLSYYDDPDFEAAPLFVKISAQIGAQFQLGDRRSPLSASPRLIAYLQGPHIELNVGTNFRLSLSQYGDSALHFGGWLRPVGDIVDPIVLDAFIVMAGYEFQSYRFGASYDINLSRLSSATSGFGALELSFTYLGEGDYDDLSCPTF